MSWLNYSGVRHDGLSTYGASNDPAELLAERLWVKGFRWAEITDEQHRVVGGVKRSEDPPHRRVWWAEG